MRRFTFNVLALLSLALLLAALTFWVRSVGRSDWLTHRGDGDAIHTLATVPHALAYRSLHGARSMLEELLLRVPRGWSTRSFPWGVSNHSARVGTVTVHTTEINQPPPPGNLGLGFGWTSAGGERAVTVPFWFFAVVFSILPMLWVRRVRRDRVRHKEGLCPRCGYDLRATPGRCPECGHVVAEDFHPAAQPVESADQ